MSKVGLGDGQRSITLLGKGVNAKFETNMVITSHYTKITFLPKNLYEQFSKPANMYFAFLCFLQTMPHITTTGQMPTIMLPLSFILLMNGAKDALEDWRRHKSDRAENERATIKISSKSTGQQEVTWSSLEVGDYIIVQANEYVPADMVLLTSANANGQAFIETANLDGETNLKTKQAPENVFSAIGYNQELEPSVQAAMNFDGNIVCEGPNASLYTYVGTLEMAKTKEKVPLDERHMVLRGCKIKNVKWCLGVVIYTGKESKIMMNSQAKIGRKLSHLERDLSKFTGVMFSWQAILCLIAAIVSAFFDTSDENKAKTYLNLTDGPPDYKEKFGFFLVLVIRFFNFLILFMNFIPISLLVSVSIVKLIQVYFIYCDRDMVHEGIHCMPRTSDLNEEMGQVEYVFSDKTGTLTQNIMDFRKFCVNGVNYGEGMTEIKRNVLLKMGEKVPEEPKRSPTAKRTPHVDLVDSRLDDLLARQSGDQYNAVRACLLHLAINHEVIPDQAEDNTLSYSASSPDESALCYGARHLGFTLRTRDSSGVTVQLADGRVIKVRIIVTLKFNSTRKRSSVIAQFEDFLPDGSSKQRMVLYTKGADSVIMERLAPQLVGTPEIKKTMEVLKEMAEDGLRTLCLGGRDLTFEEFEVWMKKYEEASVATEQREEKLDAVAEEIECRLEMHGITGIEDRLQHDVSRTIVSMGQAGIKVWMLTGDKTETAINIGIATGLLDPHPQKDMRPVFSSPDFEDSQGKFQEERLVQALRDCADKAREKLNSNQMFEGMVMDGKCLETALLNSDAFVAICKVCRTVVCCRVSPKQKGAVVRLIKAEEKAITLAIGDGANDCNMIQSADVGIGIRGLEGLQAFNVCDYGISQFRFLEYLLLVHGRWCYRRVAILVNYTFYKNIVLVLPQYYFGIVSGFSGQKLYNDFMYQLFNVNVSFFPIMFFGILDQDVSKKVSLESPELYALGPQKAYLNVKVSACWLLCGVWHSVCVFWIPYLTMSNGNITNKDGKSNDIWMVGTVVFLLVVLVVNFEVLLETCYLTWITYFGIGLSFFFWLVMQGGLSGVITGSVLTPELHGSTQRLLGSPMILLIILTTCAGALMVDVHLKGIVRTWFPTALHKVHAKVLEMKKKQ
jgi:phospholipid-translocating P-type ATPase (flippase)